MHSGTGTLTDIYLNGRSAGRLRCDPPLVPAPGQYLLARVGGDPDDPLAVPVFSAGACPGGFQLAAPIPVDWLPGIQLDIRGPLGKGFQLPQTARFVALVALGGNATRLMALTEPALARGAAVVLLAEQAPQGLPAAVEISPLAALAETLRWADTVLVDTPRAQLPALLNMARETVFTGHGQVLVETAMPCGGLAECGACAVTLRSEFKLACEDGPVFNFRF
jgi:hypothetical protein